MTPPHLILAILAILALPHKLHKGWSISSALLYLYAKHRRTLIIRGCFPPPPRPTPIAPLLPYSWERGIGGTTISYARFKRLVVGPYKDIRK